MPPDPTLSPATADDVAQALAFALRWNCRKKAHTGDEFMAMLTAERIIEHLRIAGFVVMKKSPRPPHTAGVGPG